VKAHQQMSSLVAALRSSTQAAGHFPPRLLERRRATPELRFGSRERRRATLRAKDGGQQTAIEPA
jgi:hypothetical protein